ncbi:hypothetical protein [Pseudoalteromonas spongiae]|uniref:hypothetical protein n=1 Tax=Pseudoalteromonas spongiae TaxID=298657 RepID=UPI00110BD839|nr:hypothetical protein [Pseudoalteromonas spongiae]TMO87512.1 hypothetical protein CWC15_03530 [Pseudoalteromonas spongiae]
MSILALDLLIDAGLLTASGQTVNLSLLSDNEVSSRISQYSNARIQTATSEVEKEYDGKHLSALFSTSSADVSHNKLLSSALVYESITIDDPLVSSASTISYDKLKKGLDLFSWAFELIKSGFIKVIPISFFNKPSDEIPLLYSDDAFKSSIPEKIHDFVHDNAILRSVLKDDRGRMLVLSEGAEVSRRTALNVSFKDDYWHSGVSLYLFQTLENGTVTWDKNGTLTEEKFKQWAYQTINQAMRARLIGIFNETYLASRTGHTYITESSFESKFLAMSGNSEFSNGAISAKFLEANNSFIKIESPKTIIELRDKYSTAFERFNYSLLSVTEELSDVAPENFETKAELLFHREIMPQIDEIRDNVNSISSSGVKGVLGSLVGLSAAVATGSSLPLIPALMSSVSAGMTEAFPSISHQQRLKNRPAYIWHRVTKT